MGKLRGGGRADRCGGAALAIACLALFVALGGGVYAASKAKIDGHTVRTSSLPGNRVVPGSLPGNRLRAGTIPAGKLAPGSVTGAQVDVATLGQVPSAAQAVSAARAREADRAQTAGVAANAERLNGFSAGCAAGSRQFAGACWQLEHSEEALEAPLAAEVCAAQGGELPDALALAAFAQQPEVTLAVGSEWSGELTIVSGPDTYAVVTVSEPATIDSAISTEPKKFRCVLPLVG